MQGFINTVMYFKILFTTMAIVVAADGALAAGKYRPAEPPDLIRGDAVKTRGTYNLGATGMRGSIYTHATTNFEAIQGRTTVDARQILVTHVGTNSPAAGVMKVNDVIFGIDGEPFDGDARKLLARAIQEAEKEENGGVLTLNIFRPALSATPAAGSTETARTGERMTVKLMLAVKGTYSHTAPYDCPKSTRILDDACRVLAGQPVPKAPWRVVQGLAMMATGKPEFMPTVREWAHQMAPPTLTITRSEGSVVWYRGYAAIFLCEYYLLTGDKEVLPGIEVYIANLAAGQSMYGTYGHGYANVPVNGGFPGAVPAYGALNQAGLIANIALLLGRKCGVDTPEVNAAIERANTFFSYYVDKGAIPYGEHEPYPSHGANGKNASAAVFFGLQESKAREARFFAKMVVASYKNREHGHTGQGFSYLWGPMGANIGGPAAAAALFAKTSWHRDLERRCDGSFVYTGREQYGPNATKDNTYYGESTYAGLDATVYSVFEYALPLGKLCITGKDANEACRLSREDIDEAIASGDLDVKRYEMSAEELLGALGDWSPVARGWIAEELASRPVAKALIPKLIEIAKAAEGPDALRSQGAVETLGLMQCAAALPVFVQLLSSEDRWLRVKAAEAIDRLGDAARPAITEMLDVLVANAHPIRPVDPRDPIQLAQTRLAGLLFRRFNDAAGDADRKRIYPAVKTVLASPDGATRAKLGGLQNVLTAEDVQALGPDIMAAIENPAPANTMAMSISAKAALDLLVKHRFKEAMPYCITTMDLNSWGKKNRITAGLKALWTYGGAAREILPMLDQLEQDLLKHREAGGLQSQIALLCKLREHIKNDKNPEPVRGLHEE